MVATGRSAVTTAAAVHDALYESIAMITPQAAQPCPAMETPRSSRTSGLFGEEGLTASASANAARMRPNDVLALGSAPTRGPGRRAAWVLLDCQVSTVDHRAAAGRKICPERINYRSPRLLIGSRPVSRRSEVAAQHTLSAAFLAGGHS